MPRDRRPARRGRIHDRSRQRPSRSYLYYRHRLPVRVMHWINVVALTILFMSGLQIFNAHPALYWGKSSYDGTPPVLTIGARQDGDGGLRASRAYWAHEFDTTGVLGVSQRADGQLAARGVSRWMTIPGTAVAVDGARLALLLRVDLRAQRPRCSCSTRSASRHLARDLAPDARATCAGIGASIRDHLRFRHPTGEAAKRYNVLQKLAYLRRDLRACCRWSS